jgi:hypothetical protein
MQLRKEVEALRTVAPLLADQSDASEEPIVSDRFGRAKQWP